MTVADLQLHLRNLGQFLASTGSKAVAEELKSFAEQLEPFKESRLKAFGDFLGKAAVPSRGDLAPGAKEGGRKAAGTAAEEVQRLFERVRHQYLHATDATVTREEIEATTQELGPLSKAQLDNLAKQIDIVQKFRSRADVIKAIRQKILERKGTFERVYA